MKILSMLRLLSIILLTSSAIYANTATQLADFLEDKFIQNPNIVKADVHVVDTLDVPHASGFKAYIVEISATVKDGKKTQNVSQRMMWFSNGKVITRELTDMITGDSLTDILKPHFKDEFYTQENLLYGNPDAKHKVVIFSDPLCPFCNSLVPPALKTMKDKPKTFAVYYYHFPLERLHPASPTLVKAVYAAELQGVKDAVLKLYGIKINPRERNESKILEAFNKHMGTHITQKDIHAKVVLSHIAHDAKVAQLLMVAGTPTMYFDGVIDKSKAKYKKVK